ncbi:MAG: alpha/beta fold hydrolase [Chlamydiae bacterium]|nr:alpha/beta fold hydrolase [Chlamydiota bacterium]
MNFLRNKKYLCSIFLAPFFIYGAILGYFYSIQEARIFDSHTLNADYTFEFDIPFETISIQTNDSTLSGLHFKVNHPKGVIYYLHGKSYNLSHSKWKKITKYFTEVLHHDVVMIDYRGFGKSKGPFTYEGLLEDTQKGYDYVKSHYEESKITVYGLSLGSSFATYIASKNCPKQLILEAPFYSLKDAAQKTIKIFPEFIIEMILKYPLRTDLWIQTVKCPIALFHGTKDLILSYDSSIRLKEVAKAPCDLILIEGADHDHLNLTKEYIEKIPMIIQ